MTISQLCKRRYYRLRQAGLCVTCGTGHAGKQSRCEACRVRSAQHKSARPELARKPHNQESPRWRELETFQAHCGRCGLRGTHECLPSIRDLASARRGPGAIEPEGGPTGCKNARGYVPGLGMVRVQMRQNRFPR